MNEPEFESGYFASICDKFGICPIELMEVMKADRMKNKQSKAEELYAEAVLIIAHSIQEMVQPKQEFRVLEANARALIARLALKSIVFEREQVNIDILLQCQKQIEGYKRTANRLAKLLRAVLENDEALEGFNGSSIEPDVRKQIEESLEACR